MVVINPSPKLVSRRKAPGELMFICMENVNVCLKQSVSRTDLDEAVAIVDVIGWDK